MPNTKATGVAYADPEFESVTSTGPVIGNGIVSTASSGAVASNANAGVYVLSTAITSGVTATTAPAGSLGITTNATGIGKLFYSTGSVWSFMAIS
jgi:hypothetical protein